MGLYPPLKTTVSHSQITKRARHLRTAAFTAIGGISISLEEIDLSDEERQESTMGFFGTLGCYMYGPIGLLWDPFQMAERTMAEKHSGDPSYLRPSLDDPPSTKDVKNGDPDRKWLVDIQEYHPPVIPNVNYIGVNTYKAGNTSGDVNGGSNKHRSSRERYDWMSRVGSLT